ncbi:NADH-ubiquinone oxidoreductase-F iron-sulfur binding region domain-containing protein [Amycolatopsis sp. H20-H5]|uniref:NADH-ubiquinone oxidoreductase-F iron-sulfur binding region domain-containing protein n=1 Tax=Amycolatopsis sp. H20-H5 TaxID=3046309 RepID=UPI002DBE9D20|nr:NADH-ubiquinone oxidoreductase-F iron-sulfur binding region domain-containing protein [Amycolatopsis sp. H20-H5]MEC3982700.1 NADH-ubiquinone oxidoreductase-F iron-sulfur binding region domain-containing protein [Amycolatopsis sp. H20-H5]
MNTLERPLPVLGVLTEGRLDLAGHRRRYGPIPWHADVVAAAESGGLRGRGGGGFPTAVKLRAVRGRRSPIVVANGCEGEPLSRKDFTLLSRAPHLVLDGLMLAANAVGAREAHLCLHAGSPAEASVLAALAERSGDPLPVLVSRVPTRYVASEESALVNFLTTGDARPTVTPPRPAERGVRGRPTLVDNVDTLAQLALAVRVGGEVYRGTHTTLVTVNGLVLEVPAGTRLGAVIERAGATAASRAVLVGGYGGNWLPLPAAAALPLTFEHLREAGASLGVAVLHVLSPEGCGLTETAGILAYLAGESARQCGPCMFGLPAVAADFAELARPGASPATRARLRQRLPVLSGRGACAHPDGAVRLAASALRVFEADAAAHSAGRPCLTSAGRS